jgi:hypothetical protein
LEAAVKIKKYILNILISIDQLSNTILGGDPDMTISGRAGRALKEGRCVLCRPLCWFLHLVDHNHCARADRNEADEGKDGVI